MALFNRNSGSEVPGPQVEYQQDTNRNWRALIVYLIMALLVAALVVFSGRWVYQKLTGGSTDTTTTQTPESSDRAERSEQQGAGGSGANNQDQPSGTTGNQNRSPAPSPSGGSGSGTSNNRSPGTPSPSPSNLPNNGPGHIVALFIGTSFVAGGLHYIATLRRSQLTH